MTEAAGEIVVRQIVKSSREVAFEAWTKPEHVEKWWRPTATARCTLCEIDPRVGGPYRLHMSDDAEGIHCEVGGKFHEITPPERVVYTWNARTHEGDVKDALVTVDFLVRSTNETEVVVRHSGLPDTPIREGHREGWQQMLASYERYLSSSAEGRDDDFQLKLEFDVPAERLFEQFASAEGVGNWWTKDCDFEPRVGGRASFRFDDSGFYAHMNVAQIDAPHLVEWKVVDAKHPEQTGFSDLHDWNGTTIRFEITPRGDNRARLDFTHVGLGALECRGVCSSLWNFYLNESLRGYLERGRGKPAGSV